MKPPTHDFIADELRRVHPAAIPPSDLHESILQAIQNSRGVPIPKSTPWTARVAIAAAALFLAGTLGWLARGPAPAESNHLATAGRALQSAHRLPGQAGAAALAPLAQELEFLDQDLRRAVSFVAASVP